MIVNPGFSRFSTPQRLAGAILCVMVMFVASSCGSNSATVTPNSNNSDAESSITDSLTDTDDKHSATTTQISTKPTEVTPTELPSTYQETTTVPHTPNDEAYFADLKGQGIAADNSQATLLQVARAVCSGKRDGFDTRPTLVAIGGQLVEQGITQKSAEEAATILSDTSIRHYCP